MQQMYNLQQRLFLSILFTANGFRGLAYTNKQQR